MTRARDIMSPDVECIGENDTLVMAAQRLRDMHIGSMPICGEDDRLKGMLTDRDIVVKAIAEGRDPSTTTAGSLAEGKPVTIGADDSIEQALETMKQHQVRRLPVIDGHDMVGIISQADIAQSMSNAAAGSLVEEISQPE
jgi:CBS domain-containing protein